MPLPTNYAAGQAFGPVDINNTNAAVNALFSPGVVTLALSASPVTMASTTVPILVFTGTTQAQAVTLPPTAALGQQWLIINQGTTAVVTCNGSTSGTPVTIAGGASAVLTANTTTPTTAAGWDVQYGGISITGGKIVNFANSLTFNGTDGQTFTFPATSDTVATLGATQTLTATTLSGPVLSGSITGTYTLAGTPTITSPAISGATLSGSTALGTPASGILSGCTVTWQQLSGGTTLGGASKTCASALTTAIASYKIPASVAAAGTTIGVNAFGQSTSTVSANVTWIIYVGTSSGTTGTAVSSAVSPIAASTGASGCAGQFVVQATGQGNCFAAMTVTGTSVVTSTQTATVACTTTTDLFITVAAGVSAGTSGFIVRTAFLSPGGC